MALLEVAGLRTAFHTEDGVVRAVDGVSFQVEAGKVLGIVGESGCGKSVSAMSVMRLIPDPPGRIDGGRVIWKGRDLLGIDPDEMPQIRGREIAMIFQDPMTSLNPVFTIGKQLGEVLDKHFDLRGKAAVERMIEILGQVGIADASQRLGQYPHELSGGMKQRIMIAMALMCKPDLLIADEPTTALDVTVQAQILQLMKQLQRESKTAIILITHDMGVVAEICDDVVVMYAGKVVESCGVFELFEHPRHPYTRGLLDSILRPGRLKDVPVPTIDGVVPSLINPPEGCRFADRCPRAETRCRQQTPPLAQLEAGHMVACFLPLERMQETTT
ncbi:MAG TPA: peptide ABC transporter ATP-binding protein [Candidatus Latescibacteria bacterium]|jgi:oligopeptide/dipeptide ABC transporter ATP-binding protein|nr:peptide ABC transporter ATP-binding protein [Candidatus Latescibacterota bacterium]|tara:strand:+ start:4300 stop:5289 length:990 start_codon:yes stop_codon:yes gene_type:complete